MQDRKLWTWHVGTGIVILLLLGLHMAIMHLDSLLGLFSPAGGHPIDWENVAARGKSLGFTFTYILLLGTALYHGLYGLRNIVLELGLGPAASRGAVWLITLVGVALFVLGTWAAWVGHQVAMGA